MISSLFILIVLSYVSAGTANYGTLAYDTGSKNQFSMDQMLQVNNLDRIQSGANPLVIDSRLFNAATRHCQAMAQSGVFSHRDQNGQPSDRVRASGFSYSSTAENIYTDTFGGDANSANTAYMNSQGHRANILNPVLTRVGFAVCTSSSGINFWVSDFGSEIMSSGSKFLVFPNAVVSSIEQKSTVARPIQKMPTAQLSVDNSISDSVDSVDIMPEQNQYESKPLVKKCHGLKRRSHSLILK